MGSRPSATEHAMPAHRAAASPLPPSSEGRITRLAAAHVQASCDLKYLLARAGLRLKDLEDARARIGVQNQIKFLELASTAMDDPLLGFHLAQTFEPRELGLFYYVQASCATLAERWDAWLGTSPSRTKAWMRGV